MWRSRSAAGVEFRFESDFEEDREAEATQENGPSPEHTAVHRDDDLIMNRSIEEEEPDIPREFEYYSEEDKPRNIDLLLTFTMRLNAADPRDKVFALVRLVPEGDRLALTPDNSKSVAQVYAEIAKYIIMGTKSLNILSFSTNSENTKEQIPSWAPH